MNYSENKNIANRIRQYASELKNSEDSNEQGLIVSALHTYLKNIGMLSDQTIKFNNCLVSCLQHDKVEAALKYIYYLAGDIESSGYISLASLNKSSTDIRVENNNQIENTVYVEQLRQSCQDWLTDEQIAELKELLAKKKKGGLFSFIKEKITPDVASNLIAELLLRFPQIFNV